jgi:hypothetical protein
LLDSRCFFYGGEEGSYPEFSSPLRTHLTEKIPIKIEEVGAAITDKDVSKIRKTWQNGQASVVARPLELR